MFYDRFCTFVEFYPCVYEVDPRAQSRLNSRVFSEPFYQSLVTTVDHRLDINSVPYHSLFSRAYCYPPYLAKPYVYIVRVNASFLQALCNTGSQQFCQQIGGSIRKLVCVCGNSNLPNHNHL